jgi:hypothetical protein
MTRKSPLVLIALAALLACESSVTDNGEGTLLFLQFLPAADVSMADVTSGRVRIEGPTNRTVSIAPGTSQTIEGLQPGSYSVALEGLTAAGEVEVFGETTGVPVTAGRNTSVTVPLSLFVPNIGTVPPTAQSGQAFTVQYSPVTGATAYRVEVSPNANFTGAQSSESPNTTASITINGAGPFFVRVLAKNRFGALGRGSASGTVNVTGGPASVTVTPPTAQVNVGQTVALTAEVKDANGNVVSGANVTWTSANAAIASVAGTGTTATVTGVAAGGPVRITASVGSVSGGSDITVIEQAVPMAWVHGRGNGTIASQTHLAGGTIGVTRTAPGRYDVVFNGLGLSASNIAFTAQLSAVTSSPIANVTSPGAACTLEFFDVSVPVRATVACYSVASGAAMDSDFRIGLIGDNVLGGTRAPGQRAAFTVHSPPDAASPYAPIPIFSWNSAGAPMQIIPGPNFIQHVHGETLFPFAYFITRIGGGADVQCSLTTGGSTSGEVFCGDRNTNAITQLQHLLLGFQEGRPLQPWAYAIVRSGELVDPQLIQNPAGSVVADRHGPGRYTIRFNGANATDPLVLLSPTVNSTNWRDCSHRLASSNPVTVEVTCWGDNRALADAAFFVGFLR